MTMMYRFWLGVAMVFSCVSSSWAVDSYPSKPIRIVIPYTVGGPIDAQARIMARTIQARLNVPVVVESLPGALQIIGAGHVARAPADGYTLIYFVPSQVSNVFIKDPSFDVMKAFTPIGSVWVGANVLATSNAMPTKTLAEFVEHAKKNRGALNYANTTGATHLSTALFMKVAGLEMEKIDYKGSVPAALALMANEVQAYFGSAQTLLAQGRAGKIRILAVAGDTRLPGAPEIPTFAELGYPTVKTPITAVLMAPAGVPKEVIGKLAPLVKEAVASEEMQKNLLDNGVPFIAEPERLPNIINEEIRFWAETAKAIKFEPK